MWCPPQYTYDGLDLHARAPRVSTPPPRSARSKLCDSSAASQKARKPTPFSPPSSLSPLRTEGSPILQPDLDLLQGSPLTASAKLAGGLRPSSPPAQPRRSRLQRESPAAWTEEGLWQLPNSSDAGQNWPASPSSASNATGLSRASTAAASPTKPPKVEVTPPGATTEASEPRRVHGSVSFRQAVSYVSLPSGDGDASRKQTASSDFSEASWKREITQEGESGDQWEDRDGRRRSSLASASTSATAPHKRRSSCRASIVGCKAEGGEGRRASTQRRSVAPVDLLDSALVRCRAESQSLDVDAVGDEANPVEEADEVASMNSSEEEDNMQSPKASALRPPTGISSRTTQRRLGVAAQSCSGWNVSWTAPEPIKTSEQSAALRLALRKCPFMRKIDDHTLESLVKAMPVENFDPGTCVCQQGALDDCAYVILDGSLSVFQEPDLELEPNGTRAFVRPLSAGRLFGEFSMLWSTPRTRSVYVDKEPATLGVLTQEVFRNLVVRNEMKERSRREACLRRAAMLETLDDEEIAQLADALHKKCFDEGEVIVRQGEPGSELFVVLEGTCVVTVETGSKDNVDIQECKRCHAGDMFGEKALIERTVRCATVSAATRVEVLALERAAFERMLGPLSQLQEIHYLCDPRRSIANFYLPGDRSGPAGVGGMQRTGEEPDATTWFAVYRPTSRDAIAKMLSGIAVGKGLNVKGKSAKMPNRLSGFVPFLQISQESHKAEIEEPPADARVCIYFTSDQLRQSARVQLQTLVEMESLAIQDREIRLLDDYPTNPGLDVPEAAVQQAFILKPDIQPAVGWETGRVSEPAFMDMNLQALRGTSRPKVVLYQFDQDNPMNPHGLLIAYAESTVKPVVSDFDTFLVGSRGMEYEHLPPDQAELCLWALEHTEKILRSPSSSSWTSRWLEVLKEAHDAGFHPNIPEFGFGDATSYRLIEAVIHTTRESGAIRHGAECFNFYFPQELDTNFLVVWEGFEDKPWAYMDEDELRDFLQERVEEDNYAVPLNPIWCVRDCGWFDILDFQMENPHCKAALDAWYPAQFGILAKIKALHEDFQDGLELRATEMQRPLLRSLSHCPDLDTSEKAMLASSLVSSSRSRWKAAFGKVSVMQSMKRQSMAAHLLSGK